MKTIQYNYMRTKCIWAKVYSLNDPAHNIFRNRCFIESTRKALQNTPTICNYVFPQ